MKKFILVIMIVFFVLATPSISYGQPNQVDEFCNSWWLNNPEYAGIIYQMYQHTVRHDLGFLAQDIMQWAQIDEIPDCFYPLYLDWLAWSLESYSQMSGFRWVLLYTLENDFALGINQANESTQVFLDRYGKYIVARFNVLVNETCLLMPYACNEDNQFLRQPHERSLPSAHNLFGVHDGGQGVLDAQAVLKTVLW